MTHVPGRIGRGAYIYIAGPYTKGDVARNVAQACRAGDAVEVQGYHAYIPHLNHFRHLLWPRMYEDWMKQDMAWLNKCDALVRLPGESAGADREVVEANRRGIPVLVVGEHETGWIERLATLPLRGM